MLPTLFVLMATYLFGVVMFSLYAAMFNHGWKNSYEIGPSLLYGLRWPITLIRLGKKR